MGILPHPAHSCKELFDVFHDRGQIHRVYRLILIEINCVDKRTPMPESHCALKIGLDKLEFSATIGFRTVFTINKAPAEV